MNQFQSTNQRMTRPWATLQRVVEHTQFLVVAPGKLCFPFDMPDVPIDHLVDSSSESMSPMVTADGSSLLLSLAFDARQTVVPQSVAVAVEAARWRAVALCQMQRLNQEVRLSRWEPYREVASATTWVDRDDNTPRAALLGRCSAASSLSTLPSKSLPLHHQSTRLSFYS